MPVFRVFRVSLQADQFDGWVFSFRPIQRFSGRTSQSGAMESGIAERFYVQTPEGFEQVQHNGQLWVKDPAAGEHGLMSASRVVSRTWDRTSGFTIVSSLEHDHLDELFGQTRGG